MINIYIMYIFNAFNIFFNIYILKKYIITCYNISKNITIFNWMKVIKDLNYFISLDTFIIELNELYSKILNSENVSINI